MLSNFFTIALRNLWKHRTQSLINVLGLSIGLASSIIIFFIVEHELGFDKFHTHADHIYRIVTNFENSEFGNAGVPRPLPEALEEDFGSLLEAVVPVETYSGHKLIQRENQSFLINELVAFVEPDYLKVFDFPLLEGNPQKILELPNEVVITASLSQKLFGRTADVLGEIITLDSAHLLKVSGVLADLPEQTDLAYQMLISWNTIPRNREADQEWDSFNSAFQTFVLLNTESSAEILQASLTNYVAQHVEQTDGYEASLYLQPLSSVHFEGKYGGVPHRKMPKKFITALILLATLLIILACINFINLATAISTQRAKEVGIRKTLGSSRQQIIFQFLGEAFVVTVLAVLLALGLAELGLIQLRKVYTHLSPVSISFNIFTVAFLLLLVLTVTNLAGLYPGWLLSRFRPIHMFQKTILGRGKLRFSLRQGLVVFQFFIAQVFIIGVLIVAQQLNFLKTAPLGFDQEAILTVALKDKNARHRELFASELHAEPGIRQMTFSALTAISQSMWGNSYTIEGQEAEKAANLQFADQHFFTTHGMTFLAGSVYTPSDSGSGFVVNEAFLKDNGWQHAEQAIGQYVSVRNLELPIVGIVADYHTRDFSAEIPPLIITNYSPEYFNLSIKVDMQKVTNILGKLEEIWEQTYPEYAFEYAFLDERVDQFYRDYERNFSLAQLFAGMAILISCLGLYGLVMFMGQQKVKEIGIRKVLGATVKNILSIFSLAFTKLVILAFLLAAPLAYYLMQRWLSYFAYRIEVGLVTFTASLLLTLLLVLFTVGYQSLLAARANPVDSLRNE